MRKLTIFLTPVVAILLSENTFAAISDCARLFLTANPVAQKFDLSDTSKPILPYSTKNQLLDRLFSSMKFGFSSGYVEYGSQPILNGKPLRVAYYGWNHIPPEQLNEFVNFYGIRPEDVSASDNWVQVRSVRDPGMRAFMEEPGYMGASSLKAETDKHLELVFEEYARRHLVSEADLAQFKSAEESLNEERKTYLAFIDPDTADTKLVIRVFDASPDVSIIKRQFQGPPTYHQHTYSQPGVLPIELEYPHLVLPERYVDGQNAYLMELGRFAKDDDVARSITETAVVSRLGNILQQYHLVDGKIDPKLQIYVEAVASGADVYEKQFGFTRVYGPEDLKLPAGSQPRFILKISAVDFFSKNKGKFAIPASMPK